MSLGTDRKFPQDLLGRYGGMAKLTKADKFTSFQILRDQVFISDALSPQITSLASLDNFGVCYGPQSRSFVNGTSKQFQYFMCPLQGVTSHFTQSARYCCGLYGEQICCPYNQFETSIEVVSPPGQFPPISVLCLLGVVFSLLAVAAGFVTFHFLRTHAKKEAERALRSGYTSQTAGISRYGSETLVSAKGSTIRGGAMSRASEDPRQDFTPRSQFSEPPVSPPRPLSMSPRSPSQTSLGPTSRQIQGKTEPKKDTRPTVTSKSAPASVAAKSRTPRPQPPTISTPRTAANPDGLISATRYQPVRRNDANI